MGTGIKWTHFTFGRYDRNYGTCPSCGDQKYFKGTAERLMGTLRQFFERGTFCYFCGRSIGVKEVRTITTQENFRKVRVMVCPKCARRYR